MITDDPETPGAGGWEINVTSSIESARGETAMEVPLFDFNYGFVENDQLKVEFAVLSLDPDDDDSNWGLSDLSVGYKYRFLEEDEGIGWMVAMYPQVNCPTASELEGFGSGSTELYFPLLFEKTFCCERGWINPEIGYNTVFEDDDSNSWKYGLAMGWAVTDELEVMGEVAGFVFPQDVEPDDVVFNFGFVRPLNKNVVLLGSAGRSFRDREDGTPDFFALLGFQFLFGAAVEEGEYSSEELAEEVAHRMRSYDSKMARSLNGHARRK